MLFAKGLVEKIIHSHARAQSFLAARVQESGTRDLLLVRASEPVKCPNLVGTPLAIFGGGLGVFGHLWREFVAR